MKKYFVYMMANRSGIVLYTGATNSIERRLWYHGNTSDESFTKRYKIDRIVYYETYQNIRAAIVREKEIKGWRREKKNDLVRSSIPSGKTSASECLVIVTEVDCDRASTGLTCKSPPENIV
jgi:putative endonuclease